MQTSPISSEISARVHFDELAHQAEQYRVVRRGLEHTSKNPQAQIVPARSLAWFRRLTAVLSAARV